MRVNLNFEEFAGLSDKYNIIPLWTEILADLETPISIVKKLEKEFNVTFLLESIQGSQLLSRYSFLGLDPIATLKGKDGKVLMKKEGMSKEDDYSDPLEYLKDTMKGYRAPVFAEAPPFIGGMVGYMAYDCVRYFEPIDMDGDDDLKVPDFLFFMAGKVIAFDHKRHSLKVIVNVSIESGADADESYNKALADLTQIINAVGRPLELPQKNDDKPDISGISSNVSKEEFESMVTKAKEHILDGEIFQVVLSQRFEARLNATPLDVYRALRKINPSPYMYYLINEDIAIVGASPEPLVKVNGSKVVTRPIAGTRKRGATEQEDIELEKDLLSDKKEIAEHIMLVDLGRNDLGRVCKPGSVEPDKFMFIERFSHVMHIVTNLTGELEDGKDSFDALRAVFPAGTVSGAPKIRAMQIINDLENLKRGPYAGIVGYFSFTGNLDSCITIRTIVMKDGKAYVQAGAGIVADSVPEHEFIETKNKATALLNAIEESVGIQ